MAILQQGYVLKVECDCGCKRVAESKTGRDFNEAWYNLMKLGWSCQALSGEQIFYSPSCDRYKVPSK